MSIADVKQQAAAEVLRERLQKVFKVRQAARTNLLYLCNVLLGYKDVRPEVHGEIIDHLQHFKGGVDSVDEKGRVTYTPHVKIENLEGNKNNLILFPRNHFKTSIITIAHAIQWIINYPDIRIALSMAVGDQTKKVMVELRGHFQYNHQFRLFFPEFCPPAKKAGDWGSTEEFTIPNRGKVRKEPTVCLITVGKVIAGSHYDVIKHSDLVDENNVKTPNQIADVNSHFGHMDPLLERYPTDDPTKPKPGWQDVEGTRYDFGDLYGVLLKAPEEWHALVRSAYKDDGTTIDMRRYPPAELERIQRKPEISPSIFSCQYLNKPIPPEGGLCDVSEIVFVPRQALSGLMPMLRLHCTVDLHGLEPARQNNDYTVLTVGGFDRDGRLYIVDIRRGRFTPHQVIFHVFDIYQRYPQIIDFKIEKDAHARVLLPFLQREASKRQRFPTIIPIRRDTHVSKQHRIRGLQPWFKAGILRFAEDLACKTDLTLEIMQFPSQSAGVHDDILDTLADQMQNQEGWVTDDVIADPPQDLQFAQFGRERVRDRFLGFSETGVAEWLYGSDGKEADKRMPTGVM